MGRFIFRLPDVGEGTAEAEILAWHVKAGDRVAEDQPLVDIMTDKATVEIGSPVEGVVLSLKGEAGEMAPVGATLVEFEVEGATPAPPPPPERERNRATPGGGGDAAIQYAEPARAEATAPQPDGLGEGDYRFRLPDVGEGTAEAEIVAWHVKAGDAVEEDQPLVDVMTDKATVEITSPVTGRVVSVQGEAGTMAAVGATLVVFSTEAHPEAAARAPSTASRSPSPVNGGGFKAADPASPPPPPVQPGGGGTAVAPAFFRSEGARPLTSPAIRRRAREQGVALPQVRGTGPDGRITREDFEAHVARAPAPVRPSPDAPPAAPSSSTYVAREGIEEVRVIGLRRRIAETMQQSKRRIPHFAYVEECDVTELEDLRAHLNATRRAERPKLTLLPFFIRAMVTALPDFPQINATYDDEAGVVRRSAPVHLGMATQTPNGLIVPVIRHAEARDVWDLAHEITRLAKATREGKAKRDELSGSTITLTSLGPLGGIAHTPVINPPEVAIVGPNKIAERPVVRHGQIAVRKMMNVSSSFDHRVVDGYDAAEFIQRIRGLLEHPATLFMA